MEKCALHPIDILTGFQENSPFNNPIIYDGRRLCAKALILKRLAKSRNDLPIGLA
jgi:hypothetical protein